MNKQANEQPNNIQSNGLAFYTNRTISYNTNVYSPMDNKATVELVVDLGRPL